MQSRERECIDYIRKFVGTNKVLVSDRFLQFIFLNNFNFLLMVCISQSILFARTLTDVGQWRSRFDRLCRLATQITEGRSSDRLSH
jgi:hypothetical protein